MSTVGENRSGAFEFSNDDNKQVSNSETLKSNDTKKETDTQVELFKKVAKSQNESEQNQHKIHPDSKTLDPQRHKEIIDVEKTVSHVAIIANPDSTLHPVHLLNASKVSHTHEEIEDKEHSLKLL